MGPAPQIVNGEIDDARLDRLAGQGFPDRIKIARKDGDDVDTHLSPRRPDSAALRGIDLDDALGQGHPGDDGGDERDEHLGTILGTH